MEAPSLSPDGSKNRHRLVSGSSREISEIRRRPDIADVGISGDIDPFVESLFEDTWSNLPPSPQPDRPQRLALASEELAELPDLREEFAEEGSTRLQFRGKGLAGAQEQARHLTFKNAMDDAQAAQLRRRIDAYYRALDAKKDNPSQN